MLLKVSCADKSCGDLATLPTLVQKLLVGPRMLMNSQVQLMVLASRPHSG